MQTSGIQVNHIALSRHGSGQDQRTSLHSHEHLYELMIMSKGEIQQIQPDGAVSLMKPGDITFAPPGVTHGSFGQTDEICEWYLIYFHSSLSLASSSPLFLPFKECLKLMDSMVDRDFFLVRNVMHFEELLDILNRMVKETRHNWNNQQEQLQLLLAQWFHWLLRDERFKDLDVVQQERHPHEKWIEESLHYMQTQFNRPDLGVQEVMARLPMSRSQFFQVFKQEVGQTFSEHLNEIRLKEASRLLRKSVLPITDILFRVGYQNPSHFGHQFKKHFGHPPRDHRKLSEGKSLSKTQGEKTVPQ